ncbi:hypothetical protein LIER_42228 [Lithospermum erythrorhizon]|uniref:Receptor-like serine/threonine-protein kinase n=1 Tax=Lithospermum erythrorhizon TaxID=34254 RepID=A0AAV3RP93_LITER
MEKIQISLFFLTLLPLLSYSSRIYVLDKGSSISPNEDLVISSPNEEFSAGFQSIGENAYVFAVWFTEQLNDGNYTIVWMANRDQPVNGKDTKFSLLYTGELVLIDAGEITVWKSNIDSISPVSLQLKDDGNLVLVSYTNGEYIWQSFDSPTNTILPEQRFTRNSLLVSSRSQTNHSSGFYKLYFFGDSVLRLLYDGPEITSVFWPPPWLNAWQAHRSPYNNSKVAYLNASGYFEASDNFNFTTTDYGVGPRRRLTLDVDGNFRVYSLDKEMRSWKVSWQGALQPCMTHGVCGANSICTYDHERGRGCSCLPGFKMKTPGDWSQGCEAGFKITSCDPDASKFVKLNHIEYYGYDIGAPGVGSHDNFTYEQCVNYCLDYCNCKGFQYKFEPEKGVHTCWPKTILINGYRSNGFRDSIYIRTPKEYLITYQNDHVFDYQCSRNTTNLERLYYKKRPTQWLKAFMYATIIVGAFEILCLLIFLYKTQSPFKKTPRGYLQVVTGFQKFSYAELKKATKNFTEEIGRGGGGIVYKAKLIDSRVAAVKCLVEANQGESEFLAEVSMIGNLNHMNLIEIWGYCVEGKHRILVYEYMDYGSLADNLVLNKLDFEKRYQIAVGTSKGLAYLHEECLDWVLHCDVKPHNILLDSLYQPKVADFGLAKLLNRSGKENPSFSRIRGTRGYMAPEWVRNLPITSKVDVYSYGIVVLEMITGRGPNVARSSNGNDVMEQGSVVTWIREKMMQSAEDEKSWILNIADPALNGEFNMDRMKILIKIALWCVEEDKDARPTMSRVVHELLHSENDGKENSM